jgi:pyruvate ferredoxin oxidoreductase alpha subunit
MGARDAGWIQLYAENNQEVYDNLCMAYRIGEHKNVMLPVMICQDGFITSHAVENIILNDDEDVKNFVGEYEPENYLLNPNMPMAVGPYSVTNYYFEAKRAQAQALKNAKQVVLDVAKEYEKITGRSYGLFEEYKMNDADFAVVIIGSAAGTTKDAVDKLRSQGKKVGLIKIRLFRPFPAEEIAESLKNVKAVAIMDRTESYNDNCGPLGAEVTTALYRAKADCLTVNYVYGLGGRDVRVEDMQNVFSELEKIAADGKVDVAYRYMGVRE